MSLSIIANEHARCATESEEKNMAKRCRFCKKLDCTDARHLQITERWHQRKKYVYIVGLFVLLACLFNAIMLSRPRGIDPSRSYSSVSPSPVTGDSSGSRSDDRGMQDILDRNQTNLRALDAVSFGDNHEAIKELQDANSRLQKFYDHNNSISTDQAMRELLDVNQHNLRALELMDGK